MYNQLCPVCDNSDRVVEVMGAEGILYCKRCDEHFEEDDDAWQQPLKPRKTKLPKEYGY